MSKYHLAFEIAENFARIARIQETEVQVLRSMLFDGRKDFQYKESLNLALEELGLSNQEPDEITVTWLDRHVSMIPSAIFEPALVAPIFDATFNKKSIPSELDYNRLSVEGLVNVYEIPLWLKSYFVHRYPRVQMQHAYTPVIKAITQLPGIQANVLCGIFPGQLYIWISRQDQVLFGNQFEISHTDDVLYYLSFVLQQQQLNGKPARLLVDLFDQHPDVTPELLQQGIAKIPDLKALELKFSPGFTLKSHQFCV